uniref:EF-hand domain-containing protein n=1 Tax=Pyrodinium bahamense TaxID=73915 RepID=A0A7R9ZUY2_9DINO|mmetsp:Transcript_10678/g.29592  ORF Transcript_10678/g.29592 Transcript_10678/m.29592 type:complete len:220 (+) Transcript_10678:1-660(+)
MIFTFGMLNMVVALVIDKTLHHTRLVGEHALQQHREEMAAELTRIHGIFTRGAKDGTITLEEFEASLTDSACIQQILDRMGVPLKEARELYMVLDWDQSGELTIEEFLEGLTKLQDGTPSAWDTMATHSAARSIRGTVLQLQDSISSLGKEQARVQQLAEQHGNWMSRIEARLDAQGDVLHNILSSLSNARPGAGSNDAYPPGQSSSAGEYSGSDSPPS